MILCVLSCQHVQCREVNLMAHCNSIWTEHIWITQKAGIVHFVQEISWGTGLLNRFLSLLCFVVEWCQWILEARISMWRIHEKFTFTICKHFQHSTTLLKSFLDLNFFQFWIYKWWDMHEHKMLTGPPQVSLGEKVVECLKQIFNVVKRVERNMQDREP